MSFLKLQKDKLQHYGLFEAQISFVIVGSDNYQWDGYCFASDDEEDLLEEDNDAIRMDPIFGNWDSCIHDANRPIWDPRKYFLAVFESRMSQILAEFERLVRMVAKNINQYVGSRLCFLSKYPEKRKKILKPSGKFRPPYFVTTPARPGTRCKGRFRESSPNNALAAPIDQYPFKIY